MSLKKKKSHGTAVEVTVKSKEENFSDFFWILSKNSASGVFLIQIRIDPHGRIALALLGPDPDPGAMKVTKKADVQQFKMLVLIFLCMF
jgi:hypothetical protein